MVLFVVLPIMFSFFFVWLFFNLDFLSLQSDDVKLNEDQPGYWNTLPVSDDIAVKHSRILQANSHGLGKLMATLTYSIGDDETKEVIEYASYLFHYNYFISH